MSNKDETVENISNKDDKLNEKDLNENFEKIKSLIKKNKKSTNNPILKCISFFIDNDILLDFDAFWLDSYIQICDSKDAIKEDGYYLLLIDIFKSSMLVAIKNTKNIDNETRKGIIKRLTKCGLEKVLEEEQDNEQYLSQTINKGNENSHELEQELYQ